jgi:hypothetical protein
MEPELPNHQGNVSPSMTMAVGLYEVLKKTKISRSQIDVVLEYINVNIIEAIGKKVCYNSHPYI